MSPEKIDALHGERYILDGKVVSMDAAFQVLERGRVYIEAGQIAAVMPAQAPPPSNFENCPVIRTRGTIYPGLIELHNHLSYNILTLWDVPEKFPNRSVWGRRPEYRKLISGPMNVLGRYPGFVEAVVRFVECKCLLGGVTTSQGIALFSNNGIRRYYKGVVRNVESTDDPNLPNALTRIGDVEARDAAMFLERLRSSTCLLLHLSEGRDEAARQHFLSLNLGNGEWAITPALSGIHAAGLLPEDFQILCERGGSIVWSPLSNYLLYGETADIRSARDSGVLIGIGSDWSPSGSKNLFGELKVARLVSQQLGGLFSDQDILAMATINAAKILKWNQALGSIEPGKRADLLVLAGTAGDPYRRVLQSPETAISLVTINGVPRYGLARLMDKFTGSKERIKVGTRERLLNLLDEESDPVVAGLSLAAAQEKLADGLRRLPLLAAELEDPLNAVHLGGLESSEDVWFLELDHNEEGGDAQRPHLPFGNAEATGVLFEAAAAEPLSQLLEPLDLDTLTVAGDRKFFTGLAQQRNLPDFIKNGLENLYS